MTDKPKVKGCTYKQWTTAEPSPLPDCMCEALRVQSHTANCHDGSVGCSALNWVHTFGIQVPWLALCGPTGRVESSTFSGRAYGKCRCSKGGFTQVQPATSLKNDHTLSWVCAGRITERCCLRKSLSTSSSEAPHLVLLLSTIILKCVFEAHKHQPLFL